MATSISLQPSVQTLIDALAATDNSFLARCTRDLSPSNVSTYNMHSTLWLVAAGVTFVAFTALAAGAFFYTGMFLPAYVPFVGIGALVLAMPVATFVKKFLEYSKVAGNEAIKYKTIHDNFEQQTQKTALQLQNDLASRGIVWHQIPGIQVRNPQALASLNPILAQAKYLDDKIQEDMKTKQEFTEQARVLANDNFLEDLPECRQKIYDLRSSALFAEDRALHTKVHAAFVNAVLRKGNYNGSLDDIAKLTSVNFNERMLGNELGERTGVTDFVTFKNRAIATISHADVKRMSVAELGQRLVLAMA